MGQGLPLAASRSHHVMGQESRSPELPPRRARGILVLCPTLLLLLLLLPPPDAWARGEPLFSLQLLSRGCKRALYPFTTLLQTCGSSYDTALATYKCFERFFFLAFFFSNSLHLGRQREKTLSIS